MVVDINAGNSTDCADIFISNDATDGLIATTIDARNLMDCAEDAAGGFIDAINTVYSMDCSDIMVSDYAADRLIYIAIGSGNLMSHAEDAESG